MPLSVRWTERLCAGLALAALALPTPGRAEPRETAWTTLVHTGPGEQYAVVDELNPDTPVDVQECANGWCRVIADRAVGYVQADHMQDSNGPLTPQGGANPAFGPSSQPAPCFEFKQSGYGDKGDLNTVCGKK
jgi:uncharacterized protein YraI